MLKRKPLLVLALLLCVQGGSTGLAQQVGPDEAGTPVATPAETKTIPSGQIAERSLDMATLLRNAAIESDFRSEVRTIQDDFSAAKEQIAGLQAKTLQQLKMGGPVSLIEEAEKEWSRLQGRLEKWLETLSSRANGVGAVLERVQAKKALWTLTRDSFRAEEMTPELQQVIRQVLESVEGVERQVRSFLDSIVSLQVRVGEAKTLADQILAAQRKEIRERRRNIIRIDSEPFWALSGTPDVIRGLSEDLVATRRTGYDSVQKYYAERRARVLGYLVVLSLLVAGLIFLRQKGRVWVQQDRSLESALSVLERPVAAGIIIVVLLENLLDLDAPAAWNTLLGLLLLLALLRLLPRVLVPTSRAWAYILVALVFLLQAARLTPDGTMLHRLVLLFLSLAGFAAAVWLVRKMGPERSDVPKAWLRVIRGAVRAAAVAFVVGSIANIVGSVDFAMVVVTGTLRALLAAVVILVAVILLRAWVRVVMLLQPVRRLGIVSQRGDVTRRTLFRAITLVAVIAWVAVSLNSFRVLDPVLESLASLIWAEISLGKVTLTLADVLNFALVIWVSFKVSRVICFALDTDVLPHMHLPRGVPGAVTRLTRYAVIVIGVIIAFSAAGFSIDRITIVFGALGVGIGFGLQNVVSNFVAGLVLLFERPIQVGDRVQLATVEGVVMDIGMRASTIRSYSGADIVVPNANLISAEVVNWTLRDRTRRVEIKVGVAYGTDPATVIDLLVGVAANHPQVNDHPQPEALFRDFGESSLDFELRAWTAAGRFLGVSSELRVAITQALKEANIEIPFPQRDLHLRSVEDTVSFQA